MAIAGKTDFNNVLHIGAAAPEKECACCEWNELKKCCGFCHKGTWYMYSPWGWWCSSPPDYICYMEPTTFRLVVNCDSQSFQPPSIFLPRQNDWETWRWIRTTRESSSYDRPRVVVVRSICMTMMILLWCDAKWLDGGTPTTTIQSSWVEMRGLTPLYCYSCFTI